MRNSVRVAAAAALAAASVVGAAVAQGRSLAAAARPLPGLPAYTAGYRNWTKLNRIAIPPRPTGDAHPGTKNVYASGLPARGKTRYPYGTVIVKEVFRRKGDRAPYVVAVMRKVRGSSPRNNDWQMIEYTRSAPTSRFSVLARGQICYGCHVGAKRTDFVFTRRDG